MGSSRHIGGAPLSGSIAVVDCPSASYIGCYSRIVAIVIVVVLGASNVRAAGRRVSVVV